MNDEMLRQVLRKTYDEFIAIGEQRAYRVVAKELRAMGFRGKKNGKRLWIIPERDMEKLIKKLEDGEKVTK